MSDELARQVDEVTVTEQQRERFLEILAADKMTGDARALRQAGVAGTTGQLRAYAKDHLAEDAREARGWSLTKVENCTWEVAMNTDHPAWDRANARVLKAYHPLYRDQAQVQLTGPDGGPVKVNTQHGVSLTDVAALLVKVGALPDPGVSGDGDRKALPAAPPLLAEPLPET